MAEVEGFKRFLKMTEQNRLEFTDAPKQNPKLFSKFLPFATALGVEKAWTKQFEGIDLAKATGAYYVSPHPFNAAAFGGDMNSFAGSVSSNMTVSSSSGGSGGGGSGGGGGGSW